MNKKYDIDMGEAMLWASIDDAVRNRDFDETVRLITALSTHRHLDFDEGIRTIE